MIKVLNVISDTNIGGAGNLLLNYLTCRNRNEFDVSAAMPRGAMLKKRAEALGVRVFELDCLRDKSFDLHALKALRRLYRETSPDIVHTHGAFSGRIAAKQCGIPVVFTRHSGFLASPKLTKGLGRACFRFLNQRYADRIIAVSPVCRDDLISCGISPSRIDLILNGSPPLSALPQKERVKLRRQFGVEPDDFVAGIAARIEPYKGQMFVLEAASLLKDKGIKFIIAGTGTYENEVRKRAEELLLRDSVIFTGFLDDVTPLLNILDVQINASYVETTSLSLLEGMSIGLPAIASNESGNPWVIKDGVNGLLFESRSGTALAQCLIRLLDSPELRKTLSLGAAEVYNREFTCRRMAENVESVYLKTLEESK